MNGGIDSDLCLAVYRDCNTDPGGFASGAEAEFVYKTHAGHGPGCRPFLAAMAYGFGQQDTED
ncbi:hypothetical protein [Nocardia terpenica]|uniref:hypothetical protein n=1 Tax=Nocardia terpenica TaxID=455432 RepID=UPI0012FD5CF0|nr:hypothetical protein [Nocardia terpenica]